MVWPMIGEPAQPHQRVERARCARGIGRLVEIASSACAALVAVGGRSQLRLACAQAPSAAAVRHAWRRALALAARQRQIVTTSRDARARRPSRHRRRPPGQVLQERHRGGRHFVRARGRLVTGAARRQRRRQDHHHRHDHGAGGADLRPRRGAGRRDAAPAPPRAAPDEFREPLCRHADAADGAAEPHGVRQALRRRRRRRRASRELAERTRPRRFPRPPDRQAVGRPEDARVARQVAAQPAGGAAARRADRLARSRHRRLGARPARALSRRARRHHPARLAQHERGRAAVRARHHDEEGPHRGRRHAGAPARALRPRKRWKRCSSTSRAAAAKRARRRNERRASPVAPIDRVLAAPRRRDGAALLVSAALVLAARCST